MTLIEIKLHFRGQTKARSVRNDFNQNMAPYGITGTGPIFDQFPDFKIFLF